MATTALPTTTTKSGKRGGSQSSSKNNETTVKSKNSTNHDDDGFSPSKKKRRKSEGTPLVNSHSPKEMMPHAGVTIKTEKVEEKSDSLVVLDWTIDDLTTLINNLAGELPKADNGKYNTLLERIPWENVCFDNYGPEECAQKWKEIMGRIRRFRTLTELVTDAKEWVKHPWRTYASTKGKRANKHPYLPKKPLTPFFSYFLEKREHSSQEHPEMSMTELATMLAKKYAEMNENKKLKYKEKYEQEHERYKLEMEKFKSEHPDVFAEHHPPNRLSTKGTPRRTDGPPKPPSTMNLYLLDKMTRHTNLDPAEKKEYEEKYRQMWRDLPDTKRVKWIRKAYAGEQQYAVELAQYAEDNPEFKNEVATPKSVVTKAEREILDRSEGKPEKPPNSGYSLYSKIMLRKLTDIPSKEKMVEIAKRWREMGDKEKESFTKSALEATEQYQRDYANYIDKLPEEERKKLVPKSKRKKVGTERTNGSPKPKKPMSALFFYQQEKMDNYKEKRPDMSEQEITRYLAREFLDLSEKKKEKYKKMAEEAKKKSSATPVSTVKRKMLFEGEPKKPPQSGYLMYTTEVIKDMTAVEPKRRMVLISAQWRSLPESEQMKYKKKASDLMIKYNNEMATFISDLSEEDRKLFEASRAKKGGLKKVKVEQKEAVESSEEEDQDSDKEATASSNGSGSRSEDSDGKSESGSDSKSDSDSGSSSESENTRDSSGSSSGDSEDSEDSDSDSDSSSESDK